MSHVKIDKTERVLSIYTKLMNGHLINKYEESINYGVNERSIQRDIDDIRKYLEDNINIAGCINSVVYDRVEKGYHLEQTYKMKFSNSEVLALCKIILASRAFTKKEMIKMIDKLVSCCVPKSNQNMIIDLIRNESFHYIEPCHKKVFIDTMWDLGQAIRNYNYIEIDYFRITDKMIVKRKLKPVAIMFSEYYFYFAAFIDDVKVRENFNVINDSFPTIYRIDRIKNIKILGENFYIPYRDRFEEGEFRKRIQFMYGGKLEKIKFKYLGNDIEAIIDRLPTAIIVSEESGVYIIEAEVFGKGIDMWLRSQGDLIELI